MTPDLEQARKFLELLDPDAEQFSFQTFDDSEQKRGHLAKVLHGTLDDVAPQLLALQKRGAGVFVCVNETDLQGRSAENIKRARAVFVDLDGSPVQPVMTCSLEPHIVVESSPGRYHSYWLAHRLSLQSFPIIQKRIIKRFHADKAVHDLPRVMRLPGFIHQKNGAFQTKIVQVNERLPYEANDLLNEFYEAEETEQTQGDRKPNGHDKEPLDLDALRKSLTGETPHEWHAAMLAMVAHLVSKGAEDWFILDWSLQYRWPGYSEKQTRADVQTMIDGARKKGFGPDPQQQQQQSTSLSFTLVCDVKPILDRDDIVRDLIQRRAFGECHADSAAGKTAILLDLGLHIAAGIDYRGRRVDQQPVIYLAFEGHGGIDNRVYAAKAELGVFDAPFALCKITADFKDPQIAQQVADKAASMTQTFGGDCPVVIIDTYTAALGGGASDCDPRDVTTFISNVQQNLLTTCTVILAHHFGKDSSRGGRGWSGLRAALDFELEIDVADELRTMRLTKSRDGSDRQAAFCYHFHGREIGRNQHDEPVTAVVVEHLADEETSKRGRRHSPKARVSFNRLWEMIKTPAQSFPMPDHPGLRCVLLADWENACIAPGVITQAKEERQRRFKFKEALNELIEAQSIVIDGERVYPTLKPSRHDA
jgi:hypothetical protein